MKKTLGLFLVLFVGIQQFVYAQTGIGTNSPNEQAVLEIQSVDKGVLFPSISLTSTTTFLGGISATASHTNMLVYNTNTATTTSGLDGAGYYFWNGSNWEKITGDTDGQSLAEVTAIGSRTFDAIQVGGMFDLGDLTVQGESSLQGDVRLGVTTGQTITVNGLVDTDILFFGPGRNIASTATPVLYFYGNYIKPGSGEDLDLDTNNASNRITFSNNGTIRAGVNSSTLFVGDDAGASHYKFPTGTASRSPDQVLSLDSSSEQLIFTTLLRLPTATNDGATLRWDTTGNEWQESTDLRIAPNSSSEVWINQNLLPSSTLLDIGQSGNNFDEVYADQFISSQGSVTFGTKPGGSIERIYLKFEGDSNGSMVLNDKTAMGGNYNTVFGYRNFTLTGTTGNNNVAIGFEVLNNGSTGTGDDNVGVGYSALSYNTGSNNVAVGSQALENNTGGVQNLALGSRALDANTQGQYNVAVGYNSLTENTLGEDNIAIGKQSMENNTIGDKNIVIGTNADVGANNLDNAIAIGYNSTVNASNTIRLGNTDIESIISSGTLTLDGVTYPNTTGTAGQVLTVSSTLGKLYFADAAGSSTTPTLDQVTTTGSQTNNSIQVGALTVSSTTGLSIKNGSDRYFLPTTQGTAGQSLIVSTTTTQLVFTSPYYFLAKNPGGQVMANGTALNNFSVVSSNGITIASGQDITLPQGRIYELSAALNISDDTAVGFGFYDGTNFLGVNGVSSKNGGAPQSIPARAIIDATSSSVTIKLAIKSVTGTGYKVVSDGTHIMIKEL